MLSCNVSVAILNPNQPGGGGGGAAPAPPPLDIFCDKSAVRIGLAARFHEFFPYRFAHFETKLVTSRCTVTKLRACRPENRSNL